MPAPLVTHPVHVLAVLLAVLAGLFALQQTAFGKRFYAVFPVLLYCYFVPTLLSNFGVIPIDGEHLRTAGVEGPLKYPLYEFIKDWLLPASLFLLVLSVDLRTVLSLGRNVLILFAVAVVSIILAGPLAFLTLAFLFDAEYADQVWRGLAALSGSWIGGGANMTAIKESVGASDDILGAIVVVDVAIAEIWTAILFYFAAREQRMDQRIGADRTTIDAVRDKVAAYQAEVRRPTDLGSLLVIFGLAFGCAVLADRGAALLYEHTPQNEVFGRFTWKVILVTGLALAASFTRLRRLEGAGASAVGSVLLYVLIASIGAKAHFAKVVTPENLPLVAVGALWMVIHVTVILVARRLLRAPIFFAAIASRACIGGAASAPIVAAAFHPALVPVGILLAILGYVLGTFGGVACSWLLFRVHEWMF